MKKIIAILMIVLTVAALGMTVGARDNTTVNAPYFNVKPTIDGVITEAEWGAPTGYAKVFMGRRDYQRDDNENVKVSDFCFMDESRCDYTNDLSFDFWIRWDETYVYIGVVSKDKYGYCNGVTANEDPAYKYLGAWNGDALQFGIDPAGANSNGNPSVPYGDLSKYTFVLGRTPDNKEVVLRNDFDMSKMIDGFKGDLKWSDGVYPTFCGEANTDAGYMTYEVAVPLAAFEGTVAAGKKDGFGMTIARVSATATQDVEGIGTIGTYNEYDCWLSWGDGVMGSLKDQLPEDRCGANSVILVDTPAVGAGAVDAPDPIAPSEEVEEDETTAEEADETTVADEGETTVADEEDVTTAADEADVTTAAGDNDSSDKADETTAPAADKDDAKTSGSNLTLWIIIAVVAVVVIVAIIIVVTKKKGGKESK